MDSSEDQPTDVSGEQDASGRPLGPEDAIVDAPAAAAVEPAPFDSLARADGDDPDSALPAR